MPPADSISCLDSGDSFRFLLARQFAAFVAKLIVSGWTSLLSARAQQVLTQFAHARPCVMAPIDQWSKSVVNNDVIRPRDC